MKAHIRKQDKGEGWSVDQFFYEDGTHHQRYYYKKKRALRVVLDSYTSKQLAGCVLIEKDLRNVLAWLDAIDEIIPYQDRKKGNRISSDRKIYSLVKGLFVACVSFYGKCFTECKGRKVKIEKKDIDVDFHSTHDTIMGLRHNYVAHGGVSEGEFCIVSLVLPPLKYTNVYPKIYTELGQVDLVDFDDNSENFRLLVEHLQVKMQERIRGLHQRIFEKEVIPHGPKFWYRKGSFD